VKESKFIEQNKEKWLDFENLLMSKATDPGRQSKLFVQITDDLSYARTFYRNRMVRKYLNGISQSLFLAINRSPKLNIKDFWRFWSTDLPLMINEAKNEFRVSLFIFVLAMGIGFFSSSHDPEFAQLILSKGYVEKTIQNINSNNPMGIYKDFAQVEGFLKITINNLMVACLTFIMGAFMAIGTVFMMLYNGIMVGTFQQFFIERGLFKISFLTIWQHGTLEISAIIIAGAAGLTLGRGLLFPGTFTRFQAFRISAKRGMKIMLGIFPIIMLAGFIESFFTRYTQLPDLVRLSVILVSLAFVLAYFVYYPIKIARNATTTLEPDNVTFREIREINPETMYTGGELFENTFLVLRHSFRQFFWLALGAAVLISAAFVALKSYSPTGSKPGISLILEVYNYSQNVGMFVANVFITAALLLGIFWHIKRNVVKNKYLISFNHWPSILLAMCISAILHALFFLPFLIAILLVVMVLPMLTFAGFAAAFVPNGTISRFNSGLKLFFGSLSIPFALYAKIGALVFILVVLLSSELFQMNLTYILWNFEHNGDKFYAVPTLIYSIIVNVFLIMSALLIILGMCLSYFSVSESVSSNNLKARIQQMGGRTKILGYERE
jgi:uncharacterized membrane protein SpoIIM required for sporulation